MVSRADVLIDPLRPGVFEHWDWAWSCVLKTEREKADLCADREVPIDATARGLRHHCIASFPPSRSFIGPGLFTGERDLLRDGAPFYGTYTYYAKWMSFSWFP
ncbi:hypothetical protein D9619_013462 [Psilocybe cf. subviscida]|uniref:Uncharacterized protein n=1 Tax=Psilocybe cf. subviscida TaxID=2480587 RepID=A0A8H5BRJ1_9AGAR|nr:hypothetical protein D9619_013462 [Psilocybe cf. subviscida]